VRVGDGALTGTGLSALLSAATRLSEKTSHNGCGSSPRPPSRATLRIAGPSPYRVLLLGTGPVIGFGVLAHELALGGHLARRLAAVTDSGIDMDVVTEIGVHSRDLPTLLTDVDLAGYDLVILSIGFQDVIDRTRQDLWSAGIGVVLDLLRSHPGHVAPVLVIAIPQVSRVMRLESGLGRVADRRAAELNLQLQKLCEERAGFTYVPFPLLGVTESCRERSSASYSRWSSVLMEGIAPALDSLSHIGRPAPEEAVRQAALDQLGILETGPDEVLDSITRQARRIFATAGAGISLIDRERQCFCASAGTALPELPRSEAICDHTIRTNHGMVIEDAASDPRFADGYFVTTAHLRSYAGVPIRDPHGYMIGALCVYDDKPRSFRPSDLTLLRHLAHAVEERLLVLN
jgi:hypothetical protein